MAFSNIPVEVIRQIIEQAVMLRSVKRALRLRLVNRVFAFEVESAVFTTGILQNRDITEMPTRLFHTYLFHRTMLERQDPPWIATKIRETCELLCKRSGVPSKDAKTRRTYISGLCDAIQDENFPMPRTCIVATESVAVALNSKEALKRIAEGISRTAILAAAAQLGLLDVVIQIVEEMKKTHGRYHIEEGSIFGQPFKNAAAQGHCNVVEFLLQNAAWNPKPGRRPQIVIVTKMARTYNIDMLDLQLQYSPPWVPSDSCGNLAPWKDAATGMPGGEVFTQVLALLKEVSFDEDEVDEYVSDDNLCVWLKGEMVELKDVQEAESVTQVLLGPPCSADYAVSCPSAEMVCWAKNLRTLLEEACRTGTPDMFALLLLHGAEPQWEDLTWAIRRRQLTMARQILDHGVSIEEMRSPSPIVQAIASEHIALFSLLSERGVVPKREHERADLALLASRKKEDCILESMMEALQSTGLSLSKQASARLRRVGRRKLLPDLYRLLNHLVRPCSSDGSELQGAYQGTPSTPSDWSEESSERDFSDSDAW